MVVNSTKRLRGESEWIDSDRLRHAEIPKGLAEWLLDRGSLTAKLKRTCQRTFAVRLLQQRWGRAHYSENRLLNVKKNIVSMLREVQLLCDDVPVVFARTVIPVTSLRGSARRLTTLGTRPLGQVLFNDASIRRDLMEMTCLQSHHGMYKAAAAAMESAPERIWGRRTLFRVTGAPLLVNEIFLPSILELNG